MCTVISCILSVTQSNVMRENLLLGFLLSKLVVEASFEVISGKYEDSFFNTATNEFYSSDKKHYDKVVYGNESLETTDAPIPSGDMPTEEDPNKILANYIFISLLVLIVLLVVGTCLGCCFCKSCCKKREATQVERHADLEANGSDSAKQNDRKKKKAESSSSLGKDSCCKKREATQVESQTDLEANSSDSGKQKDRNKKKAKSSSSLGKDSCCKKREATDDESNTDLDANGSDSAKQNDRNKKKAESSSSLEKDSCSHPERDKKSETNKEEKNPTVASKNVKGTMENEAAKSIEDAINEFSARIMTTMLSKTVKEDENAAEEAEKDSITASSENEKAKMEKEAQKNFEDVLSEFSERIMDKKESAKSFQNVLNEKLIEKVLSKEYVSSQQKSEATKIGSRKDVVETGEASGQSLKGSSPTVYFVIKQDTDGPQKQILEEIKIKEEVKEANLEDIRNELIASKLQRQNSLPLLDTLDSWKQLKGKAEKTQKCPNCPKMFGDNQSVRSHFATVHMNDTFASEDSFGSFASSRPSYRTLNRTNDQTFPFEPSLNSTRSSFRPNNRGQQDYPVSFSSRGSYRPMNRTSGGRKSKQDNFIRREPPQRKSARYVGNQNQIVCTYCGEFCQSLPEYRTHIRAVHHILYPV